MLQSHVTALVAQRTRLSMQERGRKDTEGLPWGAGTRGKGFTGCLVLGRSNGHEGPGLTDPAVQLQADSSACRQEATVVLPR